jgi:hypothetical protein
MASLVDFVARTHQKIEYARLVLDEHRGHQSRHTGDAFERSHLEAFIFHFGGAVDSFLQEINEHHGLGLDESKVRRDAVRKKVAALGISCPAFVAVDATEQDQESFLALAKSMRDFVAHRGGLPMSHYFNEMTNLVHPVTRLEFEMDSNTLLGGWINELEDFFKQQRTW